MHKNTHRKIKAKAKKLGVISEIALPGLMHRFEMEKDEVEESHVISLMEMAKEVWPYGFITFGGPMAHIGMFRDKFVNQLKWMGRDQFEELFAICQSLPGKPGPSVAQ